MWYWHQNAFHSLTQKRTHTHTCPATISHMHERPEKNANTTYNMAAVEHLLFGKFCTKWNSGKIKPKNIPQKMYRIVWLRSHKRNFTHTIVSNCIGVRVVCVYETQSTNMWGLESKRSNAKVLAFMKHESTYFEHMFNRFSLKTFYSIKPNESCMQWCASSENVFSSSLCVKCAIVWVTFIPFFCYFFHDILPASCFSISFLLNALFHL